MGVKWLVGLVLVLAAVAIPTAVTGAQAVPICNGLPATIVGTEGDDVITGTSGRDVIVGLGGADVIRGLAGADTICGGPGRDRILGGKQADVLIGGDDGDKLFGDAGADWLYGDRGNDLLIGGQGEDVLDGGRGRRDRLRGRSGIDTCVDEQATTSFDSVCLDGPAGGAAFVIDVCFTEADAFDPIVVGRVTSTGGPTVDALIDATFLDAQGQAIESTLEIVSSLRPGETALWQATLDQAISGVDVCDASFELFDPADEPGSAWNASLDTCRFDGSFHEATGSATNTSRATADLFIVVHVTGEAGIRSAPSLIDFVEGVPPGASFTFSAFAVPFFAIEPTNCEVFVSVAQ